MKKLIYIVLFISWECFAQNGNGISYPFWQLTSFSGSLNFKGNYRQRDRALRSLSETSDRLFLAGGLLLKSRSYIWHPNFLVLEAEVEFNPGTDQENYLVSPNRSESFTNNKLGFRATFFNQKPVNLSVFANYHQSFINREFLTNIKANNWQWGAASYFRNKFLPISVNFSKVEWEQKEIVTGRTTKTEQENFQTRVSKSFSSRDNHEFVFSHNKFLRQELNLSQTRNTIDNYSLNNNIYLDSRKNYLVRSRITNLDQYGNINYQRLQAFEDLILNLPKRFTLSGNYNYSKIKQESQKYDQESITGRVSHELFESLTSTVIVTHSVLDQTIFKESNNRAGINFNYKKNIPKGVLSLSYGFQRHHQNVDSNPVSIFVINEEHILSDDQIVLLDKPFVDISSVTVKDITGTIIYRLNLDYVLIDRNNFLEIQRVPGGQIPNDENIFIDYTANQPGSYKFNAEKETFSANISFFNRLVEFYYTNSRQDFKSTEFTEFLVLNQFNQNIYGSRFKIGVLQVGIEFDNYRSNIIPYRKTRYYLQLSGKFTNNLLFSLNGNLSDYYFRDSGRDQVYSNVFGKISYRIRPQTKLNFDFGYRKQAGREIDLDLITARTELNTKVRQLYITLGLEMFRRRYIGDKMNFIGTFFQIERKF